MENNNKKLKQSYLSSINGPILFTAPHSKKLYRGGKSHGEQKRIHLRQIYTSFLAVNFANQISKYVKLKNTTGSFCIWGKSITLSEKDRDPNYLIQKQYSQSPFHLTLHQFQAKNINCPLLHIDIHGKLDRKQHCQLDIGIQSMVKIWQKDTMHKNIKDHLQKNFNQIFKDMKIGQFQPIANTDPYLNGFWGLGCQIKTMTTQAIQMGIPSVQLQIPKKMRTLLFQNIQFRTKFLKVIADAYNNVIVPLWSQKIFPLSFNQKFLGKIVNLKYGIKQNQQLLQEITTLQKTAALDLQTKKI